MDLDAIDTNAGSFAVELMHPGTGAALLDDQGNPITISVVGKYSDQYIKVQKAQQNRRLKAAGRKGLKLTADELEAEANELIAACITGWSGIVIGGEVLEFSLGNARKLIANPKMAWVKEQLDVAIGDEANFTKS